MNQQERGWATRTAHLDDFASPWSHGKGFRAYSYPVARTFKGAIEGFKGKRNKIMFHMLNTGEAGKHTCAFCGGKLNAPALAVQRDMGSQVTVVQSAEAKIDDCSTWTYFPATKQFAGGVHYTCSWSALFGRIYAIGREI